jgi:hypothetical protein
MLGFNRNDRVGLGNKQIEIPKLTRTRLKKLTEHIGTVGDLLIKIIMAPETDRPLYIVAGADVAIDEIYEVTSLLSDLPLEYLDEHATLAECTEFLSLTWERNNMNKALGNVRSLIPTVAEQFVTGIVKGLQAKS